MRLRPFALIAVAACLPMPQQALADAATKAQEGDITQWIEYYRRERTVDRPERPTREEVQRPPAEQAPRHCGENKCPQSDPAREAIR